MQIYNDDQVAAVPDRQMDRRTDTLYALSHSTITPDIDRSELSESLWFMLNAYNDCSLPALFLAIR